MTTAVQAKYPGEVGQIIADRPGSLADEIQSELDSKRIRAKVKSTGDEFKLEFNTSIYQLNLPPVKGIQKMKGAEFYPCYLQLNLVDYLISCYSNQGNPDHSHL